ncbi:MAG: DUF5805 domain-containing protein [Halolamina sp.]
MSDGETVQVKTRVPAYQREEWKAAADRLDMSQSEFFRAMVQAGRSGFEGGESAAATSSPEEDRSSDANPGGNGLEDRVISALSADEATPWDALLEELLGDFEQRLEETLQTSDRVRYSGREGGYVLTDDGE